MDTLEHSIRERAYHLWLADGCQEGAADAHWLIAEREILASAVGAGAPPAPAKAAKRAPAKPRAKKRAA